MSALKKYFPKKKEPFIYMDKTFKGNETEYTNLLENSTTLYVGEINRSVQEERIWELFSLAGEINRVIMGVGRNDLKPCGFGFVEYYKRVDAENAVLLFNGFRLDNKCLRCDIDYGFCDGRELGRGEKGGQVKDDYKSLSRFKRKKFVKN